MGKTQEAKLYHAIKDVNDLTKSNVAAILLEAVGKGELSVDRSTLQRAIVLINGTIDQSTDTLHTQVSKAIENKVPVIKKK